MENSALVQKDALIFPFANDPLRDWPLEHYRELIEICLERADFRFRILGAPEQTQLANVLVRSLPGDRVVNDCGRLPWPEVEAAIQGARIVIGNNSGLAHLASQLGVPTLVVFSGTVSFVEWMPRGPLVSILYNQTVCSPCRTLLCPHDKRCLREITPERVYAKLMELFDLSESIKGPRNGRACFFE
jgi:ADP-heptose:LPS heptosyltransferase